MHEEEGRRGITRAKASSTRGRQAGAEPEEGPLALFPSMAAAFPGMARPLAGVAAAAHVFADFSAASAVDVARLACAASESELHEDRS
jgi:hypothetical protein